MVLVYYAYNKHSHEHPGASPEGKKDPMADDCLFCKIIEGEIPSKKVYEDDVCYAFDDIEPEAPVHTLVVPKKHYENLNDGPDAALLGHLLSVVPEIAKIKGVYESGYRVNINTGPDSASTVPHLHLHIMGGIKMGRATFEESYRLEENA